MVIKSMFIYNHLYKSLGFLYPDTFSLRDIATEIFDLQLLRLQGVGEMHLLTGGWTSGFFPVVIS